MSHNKEYEIWDKFLKLWPLEHVENMTLSEYTKAGSKDSFTWWLESGTTELGSMWGGSSFKFNVYNRNDTTDKPSNSMRGYTSEYAWLQKYGDTPEKVFEKTKSLIVEVIIAVQNGDLKTVEKIDLGPTYKWKIAFLYQNREIPVIVNVYKKEPLFYFLEKTITSSILQYELYAQIMTLRNGKDILDYAIEIWNHWSQRNEKSNTSCWDLLEKENIELAIEKIIEDNIPIREGTKYTLVFDGNTYSPKQVIGIACGFADESKNELSYTDFDAIQAKKKLESLEFQVRLKNNRLDLIDKRKEDFRKWAEFTVQDKSTINDYIKYGLVDGFQNKLKELQIEVDDFISLFQYDDINFLEKLYKRCNRQGDLTLWSRGIYNGVPSAAIKKYIDYLKWEKSQMIIEKDDTLINNKNFDVNLFINSLKTANLSVSTSLPYRFVSALQTKPFVILTGLSGSGKTKLAEAFSLWISESSEQYQMVSVGADWTNREPLLGFPNALEPGKYVKPDTGVLDLLLRASKNETRPYFLILDEMNMSHVERYFADFLSAMESTEGEISLHPDGEEWGDCDIPSTIVLPKNLFIIGTVNIDETTYMFSPKVLDRANVIEFRVSSSEMEQYLTNPKVLDMDVLKAQGASMGSSFLDGAKSPVIISSSLSSKLLPFFNELQLIGSEFGYRTASEIGRFITICSEMSKEKMNEDKVIDAAIMQKLLPKLHGSRNKIEKTLVILEQLCIVESSEDNSSDKAAKIKYPLSYEKLERMHTRVLSDGFTSFAEA